MYPILYKISTQRSYYFDNDDDLQHFINDYKNNSNELATILNIDGETYNNLEKLSLRQRDKDSADDLCNYSNMPCIEVKRKNPKIMFCNHYFLFFDNHNNIINFYDRILT